MANLNEEKIFRQLFLKFLLRCLKFKLNTLAMNVGYITERNKLGLFFTKVLCATLTLWPAYYSSNVVLKNNSFCWR